MTHPNPSTALAFVIIDELVRGGVRRIVAAPGSRSTALVLAASARDEVDLHVAVDERSAAFYALGSAKATGHLAAVVTTSGTAVANLLPAVVEADASGTALVVVSSDRPAELRRVGANQTIEQAGIFGRFVRLAMELGPAERHPSAPRWWRSEISQALAAAAGWQGRPGPVHLDVAFREPTVGVSDDGRSVADPYPFDTGGRPDGRTWTEVAVATRPDPTAVERVVRAIGEARRGVVVAGAGCDGHPVVTRLGERLGWPVIATAESGLRATSTIATGHHLLAAAAAPDLVVRFGGPGPSRRVVDLVLGDVAQVVVGDGWSDPGRSARLLLGGSIPEVAAALAIEVADREPDDWWRWWSEADNRMRSVLRGEVGESVTEPATAALMGEVGADRLAVASSMPIRDIEAFCFDPPPIVANRGASGIDGFVSTALGMAGWAERPVALTGDVSLLHDSNGFMVDPRPDCVFVVVDNGGGGIFSFLPQARHIPPDQFERLFAAPPRRRMAHLAALHGLSHRRVDHLTDLASAVEAARAEGGIGLVVVETDRAANVEEHRRLDAVAAAVMDGIRPSD